MVQLNHQVIRAADGNNVAACGRKRGSGRPCVGSRELPGPNLWIESGHVPSCRPASNRSVRFISIQDLIPECRSASLRNQVLDDTCPHRDRDNRPIVHSGDRPDSRSARSTPRHASRWHVAGLLTYTRFYSAWLKQGKLRLGLGQTARSFGDAMTAVCRAPHADRDPEISRSCREPSEELDTAKDDSAPPQCSQVLVQFDRTKVLPLGR